MGQDLARLSNECDCWVAAEEPHSVQPLQPAKADPLANLVTEVPKSTLVPKKEDSPPSGPIAPPFYNIASWAQEDESGVVPPPPPEPLPSPEVSPKAQEVSPKPAPPVPPAVPAAAVEAGPGLAPRKVNTRDRFSKFEKEKMAKAKESKEKEKMEKSGESFSIEAVLTDLEGAEEAAFTAAFKSLSNGKEVLPLGHDQLRSFILINSGITDEDLEMELLKVASGREDLMMDKNMLISLLREHPVGDNDALSLFMNLAGEGEGVSSEECRTGLLQLTTKLPDTGLSQERLDRVFDTVMTSAGLTVSMEEWLQYAKTAARILRLIAYTKA